jgi:probable F420-dependent oxidoreductase
VSEVGLAARLSIALPLSQGIAPADLVRVGVEAERLGFHGVDVGEHASTDAMAMLGALAAATSRIQLSSAVISPLVRSPSLIAMGAATMASLAPGRFILGLGVGSPLVAGWHGQEYRRPVAVMERTLEAVRRALSGQSVPEWGRFRLTGIEPAQVPIHLAALNPRMLRLAAERADGLILNFAGPDHVRPIAAELRALRARLGLSSAFVITASTWAYLGPEPEQAEAAVRRETSVYLAVPTYQRMAARHADEEQVLAVERAWREGGRQAASKLVPQSVIDGVYAGGRREQIEERIARLVDAGADLVRLLPVTTRPGDLTAATELVKGVAR